MFDIKPMHYKEHKEQSREWEMPESGIVSLYHCTNAGWESFVSDGILAGGNRNVYAHQAPLPFPVHNFTIEFEADIFKGDMFPAGWNTSYRRAAAAYENPHLNSYYTDFEYLGVWVSGGKDIKPSAIKRIVDNETNAIVYERV